MPSRDETLKIGYIASELDMSFEAFKNMLRCWHIKPIEKDGKTIGMTAIKNTEIHVSVLPEYRRKWFSKRFFREVCMPIMKNFGYVTTAVPDNKPHGHEFVKRVGFVETGRVKEFTFYKMERAKWV